MASCITLGYDISWKGQLGRRSRCTDESSEENRQQDVYKNELSQRPKGFLLRRRASDSFISRINGYRLCKENRTNAG